MTELTLPWPPSLNSYWRHPSSGALAGRHLISAEGRTYRHTVAWQVRSQKKKESYEGRLSVVIKAAPPDRRKRDLDNLLKSLLDALGHAGVYVDDSQIDSLTILRMAPQKPGVVFVTIEELMKDEHL